MQWHIICRVGAEDDYSPEIRQDEPRLIAPIDHPGERREVAGGVLTGFRERTGLMVPAGAVDLLNLAIGVYAADLRVARKFGEDRWSRDFVLYIPVHLPDQWEKQAARLRRMLGFLTGDNWELVFRTTSAELNPVVKAKKTFDKKPSVVTLFSGGLDSLVGAIDLLAGEGEVALVGHYGSGITHSVQEAVVKRVAREYPDRVLPYLFHVQPPRLEGDEGEPSMRSRSILFLALGTVVASSFGDTVPLQVAENGFISLNAPTTYTRLGSFSTRTTHPYFIEQFRALLRGLKLPTKLSLPYRFHTKGGMLIGAKNQGLLREATPLTMSCAHPEAGRHRKLPPNTPCGYCVPCIIRRAAVEAAGVPDRGHCVDVRQRPPRADTQTGRDFRAFEMAIARFEQLAASEVASRVSQTGPLPAEEFGRYVDTYRRGIEEVRRFLQSSPVAS